MSLDKREHEHSEIFLDAEFRPENSRGEYYFGLTSDISETGLRLEAQSHAELYLGDILEIILKHPQSGSAVSILGKIIWTKSSWYKYIIGITFHNLDRETHRGMQALLSTVIEISTSTPEVVINESPSLQQQETCEKSDRVYRGSAEAFGAGHDSLEEKKLLPNSRQVNLDNAPIPEIAPGNRGRILVILITVAVIVFLIALPVIYESLDDISKIPVPDTLSSSSQNISIQQHDDERDNNFLSSASTPETTIHRPPTEEKTRDSSTIEADWNGEKLGSPSAVAELEETEFTVKKEREYAVNTPVLNIRATPSVQSPIVGKTPKGTVFTSAEKEINDEGLWLKTDKGYVSAWYTIDLKRKSEGNEKGSFSMSRQYATGVNILNIRATPSVRSPVIGKTLRGDVFTSAEIEKNDEGLWLKTEKGYIFGEYAVELNYKKQEK